MRRLVQARRGSRIPRERVAKLGVEPLNLTLDEFKAMIRKELEDNAQLVRTAGIKTN